MKNQELSLFVGSKIKEFRKSKKFTQAELSEKVGVGKSTIANYEKGYRSPSQDTLFILADILGVSIDDFFPPINEVTVWARQANTNGVTILPTLSKQEKNTQNTDLPSTVAKLNSGLNQDNHAKWVDYGTALLEEQEGTVEEVGLTYDVETVSSLAAGLGFSYDDGDTYTVQVTNEPPRHDIASIVSGDSMLPNYHDGDVVYLVDKGISNYSGQVCAVVVNDKTYLKRVYTEPNALRLVSINPKYSDIVIDFPPSEDTHIKIFSVIGSDRTI